MKPTRIGPDNGECYGCKFNTIDCGGPHCSHPKREYERLPIDNHTPDRCPVLKQQAEQAAKGGE